MGNALGNYVAVFSQAYLSGKPKWSTADIPDLSGKVVIVTGGNSGIGKETVKALLEHNAKVYILARNRTSAEDVIEKLRRSTGKTAYFIPLDLAVLPSVKTAASEFMKNEEHLHILFNNGGVMLPPANEVTAAGHDLCFGVNVLGHFYLTKLLMPVLLAAVADSGEKVRVVNTSSSTNYLAKINFDTFKDGPARRRQTPVNLYSQSKWGNVVFAAELARQFGTDGIVSTSLNPGNLKDTNLTKHVTGGYLYWMIRAVQIYPPEYGALTQLYAGTSPEGESFNGKFLIPWAKIGKAAPSTADPEAGRKLWEWLEAQVVDV
ncbi:NAD(P)-binding protein [Mycena rebaudengoi]|nr:NAD(P)-binding protein [Mycena rebaudengoi]